MARFGLLTTVALLVVTVLLSAYAWREWQRGPAAITISQAPAIEGSEDATELGPGTPPFPPLEDFEEIAARPLFRQDRRPPEETPEEPVAAAPAAPPAEVNLMLTGVLITPQQRLAILKPTRGGDPYRVKQGDLVDGWRVEQVAAQKVELRQGARRETLELELTPPEKNPAPAPKQTVASGRPVPAAGQPPARPKEGISTAARERMMQRLLERKKRNNRLREQP